MKKRVIIINGKGGAGKDTLCSLAAKHYRVENISAITPVKEIAKQCGWVGEKDAKGRKFLSDLKQAMIEYNDLPLKYLCSRYDNFLAGDGQILFVQIREKDEIEKFRKCVKVECITLLVERDILDGGKWGNASDDGVKDYPYDFVFKNEGSLAEAEKNFLEFLKRLLDETQPREGYMPSYNLKEEG